eukprot:7388927-Prymnesium_polylepis.1
MSGQGSAIARVLVECRTNPKRVPKPVLPTPDHHPSNRDTGFDWFERTRRGGGAARQWRVQIRAAHSDLASSSSTAS